jgi:hypothetical protein
MRDLKLIPFILVSFALARSAFPQDSLALKVRSALKYKFPLDFVLHLDSASEASDSADWGFIRQHYGIHIQNSSDPNALEQFECYASQYSLYRLSSFTAKARYFVLAESGEDSSSLTFYLFTGDSIHPRYLDKYAVGTQQASFRFDTLNGGDVFRINAKSTGTGLYDRSLILIAIKRGFLVDIFHCDLRYLDATTDTTFRGLGSVKFVDLNKDGYLDIVYKLVVDVLAPSQNPNVWIPGKLEKAKALYRSSRVVEHYIWNRKYAVYERQK